MTEQRKIIEPGPFSLAPLIKTPSFPRRRESIVRSPDHGIMDSRLRGNDGGADCLL
jgi:hypothetical protein